MNGPFSGVPIAITTPWLFVVLAPLAIALFVAFNGGKTRVRVHSPVAALVVLAVLWGMPHILYAIGSALPGRSSSVMRVEESHRWYSARSSNWVLSLRDGGRVGTYDFNLSGARAFRDVDLSQVAPGSCVSVSAVRFPGAIAIYDAAAAACPSGSEPRAMRAARLRTPSLAARANRRSLQVRKLA